MRSLFISIALAALVLLGGPLAQGQTSAEKRAALRTPVVQAVEIASPAVVNISTEKIVSMQVPDVRRHLFDDDLLDKYFEKYHRQDIRQRSLGSGVLFDARGYIVTNDHVVRRASKITVTLKDKSSYQGRLISSDPTRDLAVVKISRETAFPAARMGRLEPLMVGETAIAVGNPFGFEHTVTTGVVSAVGRSVSADGQTVMANLLQTDASINPGNSGGALIDINGDLIGIPTAMKADAEGIGFAIPVDEVRRDLVDLLDFRRLSRVYVGCGLEGLVSTETGEPVGMRVLQLQPESPADKAGLKYADVIMKLNGRRCVDILAFEIDILEHRSGDKLIFEGVRPVSATEGRAFRAEMVLEPLPSMDATALIARRLGLAVSKLDAAAAGRVGLDPGAGVLVQSVVRDGPAAASGLSKDDVILLFANFRVNDPDDLATGLGRIKPGDQAVLVLIRKGNKFYTWIKLN